MLTIYSEKSVYMFDKILFNNLELFLNWLKLNLKNHHQ